MDNVTVSNQVAALNKYSISGACDLTIRSQYFSQRDNYTQSHRTCNSSSNAMYLNWVQGACGRARLQADDDYLRNVLSLGDTTDHGVQTQALKRYGYDTFWHETGDQDSERDLWIENIQALLQAGIPCVVNIAHRGSIEYPRGGHVIMLVAFKRSQDIYSAQDPYGTLQSNYSDENGRLSTIGRSEFYGRWQGGLRLLRTAS
jgi:Peptidase_C39 like family